ncbi:hypothetical protein QJS10_CPB13g01512 [Acorus calamus]|uniref:RRM domain-containing protein n=1 Tax=Acorus calamus TaxID=4465 RepID=A0AAV9DFK4_ACOCL|nr:hypothetical protein QJS10_CPB13g01512 [Acorus calamus]
MAAMMRGLSRSLFSSGHPKPYYHLPLIKPSSLLSSRGIASKLFVGGLSYYTNEEALAEAFSHYGQVIEAKIVMNKEYNRSKGFGFVTFASEEEAEKALAEMNGKVLNGRAIFVDNAKPNFGYAPPPPIARGPPESSGKE